MRWRFVLTTAWVSSVSMVVSLAPCWALKPGEHIELEQRADRFGSAKIFFDNQSLKILLKTAADNGHRQDLTITSKAPNWHVRIFNNQLKLKYSESVFGIAEESQLNYGHMPPVILKPCVESNASYMGQPARVIVGKPKDPNVDKGESFLPGSLGNEVPAIKIERLEYAVLQERVPPGLCHVVQAFLNVPKEDRYPLNFVQVTTRGSDKLMTTISVCKKPGNVVLPAEPNYKTVDNLLQVKYGMQQDNIKDIGLQLLDGGSR